MPAPSIFDTMQGMRLFPRRRERASKTSEEQEESLLRSLGGAALSGISAFGNLLDVPGSMVRDTVSGNNPFDQLLTPFSDVNRKTGRQLLRDWGAIGSQDTIGNFLGGVGTEILMDPLTIFNPFGKFTKAGSVAKKSGLLDDFVVRQAAKQVGHAAPVGKRTLLRKSTLRNVLDDAAEAGVPVPQVDANLLDQPLRTMGWEAPGLPLIDLPFKAAGKLLGPLGEAAKPLTSPFTKALEKLDLKRAQAFDQMGRFALDNPLLGAVTRPTRAMFQADVRGVHSSREAQDLARLASVNLRRSQEAARETVFRHADNLQRLGVFEGPNAAENAMYAYRRLEGGAVPANAPMPNISPEAMQAIDAFAADSQAILKEQLLKEQAAALPTEALDDAIPYFPRQRLLFDKDQSLPFGSAPLDPKNMYTLGRKYGLRDILAGTEAIMRMSMDDSMKIGEWNLVGLHKSLPRPEHVDQYVDQAAEIIAQKWGDWLGPDAHYKQIAQYLMRLDPRHALEKVPSFTLNPVENLLRRLEHGNRAVNASLGVVDMLARMGVQGQGERQQSLYDWMRASKLLTDTNDRPLATLMERLQAPDLKAAAEKALGKSLDGADPEDIAKNLWVPLGFAQDLTRYIQSFTAPEELHGLMKGLDWFNRMWKTSVTSLWPAFHVRNFVSGQYQNYIGNAYDPRYNALNPRRWAQPLVDGLSILLHRPDNADFSDLFPGMGNEQAMNEVRRLLFKHNVFGRGQSYVDDLMRPGTDGERALRHSLSAKILPGASRPSGLTESVFPNGVNIPLKSPTGTIMGAAQAGSDVGNFVEGLNRISPFVAYLRQGLDPAEAARRVKALQIDYTNLSHFERKVMRQVFPFYAFTRRSMPMVLEELFSKPGGKLSQTLRITNRGRENSGVVPEHIGETTSLPWGLPFLQPPEGTKRFVSGLGLMFEDPLQMLGPLARLGHGGGRDFGLETLSRMSPVPKGVLELVFGESTFQRGPAGGRELLDLDPLLGRTISNVAERLGAPQDRPFDVVPGSPGASRVVEEVLANSPLSRVLSSARTFSDPRKQLPISLTNFLTGLRVSDVSPGARDATIKERIQRRMREIGAKQFERVYFRPEDLERLSPENQEQAILMEMLMNSLAERSKQRAGKR